MKELHKARKLLAETTSSKTYKSALKKVIGLCPFCPPNRGCNRRWDNDRNWKKFRKTQWKNNLKKRMKNIFLENHQ